MKVITIAAAILLATPLCTFSQTHTLPTSADEYRERIIQRLISPTGLSGKTTQAVKERLIGESVWQYATDTITGAQMVNPVDTVYYSYTGNHGSYWDPRFSISWFDIAGPGAPMGFISIGQYDTYVRNGRPSIVADMGVYRSIATPDFDSFYRTYNIDNDILTQYYYGSHPGYSYDRFTASDYDASGNIVAQTVYTSPSRDSTITVRHLVYNEAGILVIDSAINNSTLTISANSKYVYSYNTAGNVSTLEYYISPVNDPGNWALEYNYVFDYYDFGKIKTLTWGTYPHINSDSFGWTPDHKIVTFRSHVSEYSYPRKFVMVNHISASDHLIDTSLRYQYDMDTDDTFGIWRLVYSNDQYANVVHVKQLGDYTSTSLTNQLFYQTNYYYEKYDTTKNPSPGTIVMTVYPVPANDVLNILFTGITQATPFTLRLIDMAGREVMRRDVTYTSSPIELPVALLASGIYVLAVYDNTTNTRYIAKVARY